MWAWLKKRFVGADSISPATVRESPSESSKAGPFIRCFRCKQRAPRSVRNHAYCEACEQAIRQAHAKKHDCPRCGSAGQFRGKTHWTGVTEDGVRSGGSDDQWFCSRCQEPYLSKTN